MTAAGHGFASSKSPMRFWLIALRALGLGIAWAMLSGTALSAEPDPGDGDPARSDVYGRTTPREAFWATSSPAVKATGTRPPTT
jgi:hypothetical protein